MTVAKKRFFVQAPDGSGQWLEVGRVAYVQMRMRAISKKVDFPQRFAVVEDPNPPLFKSYPAEDQVEVVPGFAFIAVDSLDHMFQMIEEQIEKSNTTNVFWTIEDGYMVVYKCTIVAGTPVYSNKDWMFKTRETVDGSHWDALRDWAERHPDAVFVKRPPKK